MFYGRAELKQSDHRPVIAVVDVQVRDMMIMTAIMMMMVQARVIDKRRRDASLASISGEG